jgi:hypothetical protein
VKRIRKFLVAVAGTATNAVAAGLVPEKYVAITTAAIGLATAVAVFLTPNEEG